MVLAVRDLFGTPAPDVLAEDVTFHSPVTDYSGRADIAHLFAAIGRCLTSVEEGTVFTAGSRSVTEFTGRVGEHDVDGVLVQRTGDDGRLEEATLLLRPFTALRAAVAMMGDILGADPLPSRR
jgi:hypothetical protein